MTFDPAADLSAATKPHFAPRPPSLELDASRYMEAVDELDMSEAEKVELLTALWGIMRTLVQLGVSSDLSATVLRGVGLSSLAVSNEEGSE